MEANETYESYLRIIFKMYKIKPIEFCFRERWNKHIAFCLQANAALGVGRMVKTEFKVPLNWW